MERLLSQGAGVSTGALSLAIIGLAAFALIFWQGWKTRASLKSGGKAFEAATHVVDAYDDLLTRIGDLYVVRDETDLPYPKDVIMRSIRIEYACDDRREVRDFLVSLAARLALFRPGIGSTPIALMPDAHHISKLQGEAFIDALVESQSDNAKFNAIWPEIALEIGEIERSFKGKALQLN